MSSEVGTPAGRPIFHAISPDDVSRLVQYGDSAPLVSQLRKAERSRRLLLLRGLLERGGSTHSEVTATFNRAWSLLEQAQRVAPDAVDEILMCPGTGVWANSILRQMQHAKDVSPSPPLWVSAGRLSAMAVAAAVRARLTFRLEVPVQRGNVFLPCLGCARFAGATEAWGSAHATGHAGSLCIVYGRAEVYACVDKASFTPSWSPIRRLTVGHKANQLSFILDEYDPYRDFASHLEPNPLNETDFATWCSSLEGAWNVLTESDPQYAEEMIYGPLLSLAPTEQREKHRPYSSSSGEAFGGINASLPDNASQLASTLVHEFQHIKLGALIHLEPVVTRAKSPQDRSELFYAPWRDDPRPIEGLIQGIYAFYGVARFWRARRRSIHPNSSFAEDFEFALCREQVQSVLTRLGIHHRLTSVGRYLIQSMASQCAVWAGEKISPTSLRLAQEAIADHSARWRSHHLRPNAEDVSQAIHAWRKGMPPPAGLSAPPRIVPDSSAAWLDTAATLTRHRFAEPTHSNWAQAAHERVGGATGSDALLALGERAAARRAIVDQLARTPTPPVASWAILGRAMADAPEHRKVSQFLLRFPERARAVHTGLTSSGVTRIDPIQLAAWLASGP